jgi:hypothetical protein
MEPLKSYSVAGYHVRLYANRVDVVQSSCMGSRTNTILLRNVTGVTAGMGQQLEITTADGKRHRLMIGGKAAEEMRDAILAAVP